MENENNKYKSKNFIRHAKGMKPHERKEMATDFMEIAEALLRLEIDFNDASSMDFKGMTNCEEAKYRDAIECLAACRKGLEKT